MRKQTIVMLAALLVLSVFAVGCSSSSYDYEAPPGNAPVGGGCGVGAPADVNTDNAEKVSTATNSKML